MDTPAHRIGRELRPSTQLEQRLHRIEQGLARRRILKSPGVLPAEGPDGTLIKLDLRPGGGTPGSPSQRFQIVTIEGDYLTARKQAEDGTVVASETVTNIAKPAFLRVTGIHGIIRDGWSYSVLAPAQFRTLTNSSAAGITSGLRVIEDLEPSYKAGDTIFAIEPTGKTGVTVAGTPLTWLDSNVDARHYRNRRIMLDACVLVNGTPTQKTIVFNAGPIP